MAAGEDLGARCERVGAEPALRLLPEDPMGMPLRFLIADDNRDAAETLGALLSLSSHEVRVVSDGSEAVEMADDWGPDVVVLDLQMPKLSGFVAAEMIRRQDHVLVLAALTGLSGETVQRQVMAAGFDLFFSKGVAFSDLADALVHLAEERLGGPRVRD